MKLKGKTALITGATSGIGLATAELFVREGARVIITGRDAERLERARAVLGGPTLAVQADVRSVRDLQRAAQQIEETVGKGGLDIFFANAGIAYSTHLQRTDEDSFEGLFDTNVKGLFFSMQSVLPLLRDGASVILNSAWLNTVGMPGFSALAATKSAVRSFARSWSAELLTQKIRVNVVSPGAIDTPIFELEGLDATELEGTKRQLAASIPVGRMGLANEIADAVLFLASDDSRYMLGSEIVVDGGFSQL